MAHDSFGVPRYGGRGNIFERLLKHKKKYPKLLLYFSFYIVRKKIMNGKSKTSSFAPPARKCC